MKSKARKIIAFLLMAAMISSVSGCTQANAPQKTPEATAPTEKAPVGDDIFPLAEPLELTVFVNATTTGGGTYQENYVTDWIKEKTNIQLKFLYDLDGDDAKTKLNLIMTSPNDIPDIFLATGWTKSEVQSYGNQGLILPLNEYLSDAPNWNKMNEISPEREKDLTMPDGNIYTYGGEDESLNSNYQNKMWIYKPWVDQLLDGKMPETTEELYQYMVAIKEQDPNGNGKADEIPMSGMIGGWATDPTVWLINSFLQCNNPLANTNPTIGAGLVVSDGKIEYAVTKEDYRDALKYINKLYEEKLLDPQTFTREETQYKATLDNEENLVGLHAGGMRYAGQTEYGAKKDGRWKDWVGLDPVAGPDGVRLAGATITNYFASAVGIVSANCKNPEIAVALFDFLASEESTNVQRFGPEGHGWRWTSEGVSLNGGTPKFEQLPLTEDFDWIGNGFKKEYKTGKDWSWASDAMIGSRSFQWRNEMGVAEPAEYNIEYALLQISQSYQKYAPEDDTLVPSLAFEGDDARAVSEYTLTIGDYVNQAAVQFITGAMDIDREWDSYLNKLETMGLKDFLGIYQKCYDDMKK